MAKTYINDGIIGNCRMLGCLTKEGELTRLFWPNIDHLQQIERFEIAIRQGDNESVFLTDPGFTKKQEYLKGTNILNTIYINPEMELKIVQSDFCLTDRDVMVRRYELENLGSREQETRLLLYSSSVTSSADFTGTLFDFNHEALVHYRRDRYMSVSSELEAESFQLGGNTREAVRSGKLDSQESVLMVHDGALSWNLGRLEAKGRRNLTMQLCFEHSYKDLKKLLSGIRKEDSKALLASTESYWKEYLDNCRLLPTKNQNYDKLYERTLLVFKLMYDESTGGLMAAPEVDEAMEMCGRYAYCWGRDAAFIADALDQCGLHREVEQFFYFAAAIQEENGSWFQRYCLDGNLAPGWGLQIDETGALLYGMWKHYERTGNKKFLKRVWDSVELGADFLVSFIDPETGLPGHSRDLWEERWGEHTYSAAAVHAGLTSAVKIAESLGTSDGRTGRWAAAAQKLRTVIGKVLWEEEKQCFLRGIRTQLYPESKMEGLECMTVPVNSKGARKKVVCKDETIDISLIGLSVPFGVLETYDPRMVSTVKTIEEALKSDLTGGIKRYEDDEYIGGNPWIITTLWLALYYIENKEFEKARTYFDWAVKGRTELDLLPEQISKDTGKPVWIIPLTWSHAMYALVYHALQNKNLI
jgi:oligosaccharide amylase